MTLDAGVRARGLHKRFGATVALASVDLDVPRGAITGVLGPNGAGKTTLIRILTTRLRPDGGVGAVAGFELSTSPDLVRRRIGVAGQAAAIDDALTAHENLRLVGRLRHLGRRGARREADRLVDVFELGEVATRPARTHSGGLRRRLDLAAAVVGSPEVLFLDEPTTGLAPMSRRRLWDLVRSLAASGTTVVLTTQYLEEADALAGEIHLIVGGRVVASGSASQLKAQVGEATIELSLATTAGARQAVDAILASHLALASVQSGTRVRLASAAPPTDLRDLLDLLAEASAPLVDVDLHRPTLDDVLADYVGAADTGAVS